MSNYHQSHLAKVMAATKSTPVNPELCGEDKQTTENHKTVTITTDGAEIWDALLKTISETVNNPVYYYYLSIGGPGLELLAVTLISQIIIVLEPLRSLGNLFHHHDCKNTQEKLIDKAKCTCECPQKEECKCNKKRCSCACNSYSKFKEETCCFVLVWRIR